VSNRYNYKFVCRNDASGPTNTNDAGDAVNTTDTIDTVNTRDTGTVIAKGNIRTPLRRVRGNVAEH
jgi:hypothetical protein